MRACRERPRAPAGRRSGRPACGLVPRLPPASPGVADLGPAVALARVPKGGRRRARSGIPVVRHAMAALAEIRSANGCVASMTASMPLSRMNAARPSAPPKPPTRCGRGGRGRASCPAGERDAARGCPLALRAAGRARRLPSCRRGSGSWTARADDVTTINHSGRWLSIVGIGEDGLAGLAPAARAVVDAAELLVGGERHLAFVEGGPAERLAWPSPLTDAIPRLLASRGRRGRRARLGRSLPVGNRRDPCPPCPAWRDRLPSRRPRRLPSPRLAWVGRSRTASSCRCMGVRWS